MQAFATPVEKLGRPLNWPLKRMKMLCMHRFSRSAGQTKDETDIFSSFLLPQLRRVSTTSVGSDWSAKVSFYNGYHSPTPRISKLPGASLYFEYTSALHSGHPSFYAACIDIIVHETEDWAEDEVVALVGYGLDVFSCLWSLIKEWLDVVSPFVMIFFVGESSQKLVRRGRLLEAIFDGQNDDGNTY